MKVFLPEEDSASGMEMKTLESNADTRTIALVGYGADPAWMDVVKLTGLCC
ncbi:hypothetical protein Hanom_Chr09g00824311 [Helianthus anomalus]